MINNTYWDTEDLKELNKCISEAGTSQQGGSIYANGTRTFSIRKNIEDVRQNLIRVGELCSSIVEVGFNAGHSNMLFLLLNPKNNILNFDLMGHKYSEPCLEYLKSKYNVKMIKGNSIITIPEYEVECKYDAIHIDGGHGDTCAFHDLVNCRKFAHKKTLLIFDDTNSETITNILEFAIRCKWIKEINYDKQGFIKTTHHRIFNYNLRT